MTKEERLKIQSEMLINMKAREDELRASGKRFIAGIDEVGRGPLAGPVYAAVVVMPADWDILGVNDSKKVSAKKREELSLAIKEKSVAYGIGIADNTEIDDLNILEATKLAMTRAIDDCNAKLRAQFGGEIDYLLIDAVKLPVDIEQESIIKGDEKCLCIAAASIVAKVARDSYMVEMDAAYPGYDFAGNKGYGTAAHYAGLREKGYSPIHRMSFLKKFEEEQAGLRAAAHGRSNTADAANTENQGDIAVAGKKKVYAVRKGRETGIFTDWDTCKKQVDGYAGAEYKGFADPQEALAYLGLSNSGVNNNAVGVLAEETFAGVRAYVDGSYNAATKAFSCGVVMLRDGEVIAELKSVFSDEAAATHRNVAGEVMGARTAIEYCLKNGIDAVSIYHDYEGVGKWANNEWKANHALTRDYKAFVAEARKTVDIKFVKVKAHAGNKYNEIADKLAKEALEM